MGWHWRTGIVALGLALAGTARAQADAAALVPDASVGAALRSLAQRASDVFVGQVESITRKGGVVEIVFRVQQSVAGAQGSTYTLREWAGRWPLGMRRYTVGARAMVFLHAAGATGLSSPVDGAEGVVPVLPAEDAAAVTALLLDVRMLATRVQRATTAPLAEVEAATVKLDDATTLVTTCHNPDWREPVLLPLPLRLRQQSQPGIPGQKIPLGGAQFPATLQMDAEGIDVR